MLPDLVEVLPDDSGNPGQQKPWFLLLHEFEAQLRGDQFTIQTIRATNLALKDHLEWIWHMKMVSQANIASQLVDQFTSKFVFTSECC